MKQFKVPLSSLQLDQVEIYRTMGSVAYHPDEAMCRQTEQLIETLSEICHPQFGYKILRAEPSGKSEIRISDRRLAAGEIITPYLAGAEYYAIFVATAGQEYDTWLHRQQEAGNLLEQFIGDAIGSEIAESAARSAIQKIEEEASALGMRISRSYSPGYCGWPVSDQKTLFSLLSSTPCGIRLNDSSLMLPIKSVSGIVAIGRDVRKMAYGCALCGKADCYKKRGTNR